MLIQDQFGIIQNLQTSPTSQTSFLVGTFFAASYSKTAIKHFSSFAALFFVNFTATKDEKYFSTKLVINDGQLSTPAKKLTHLVGAKTGNPKNFLQIRKGLFTKLASNEIIMHQHELFSLIWPYLLFNRNLNFGILVHMFKFVSCEL